MQNRIDSPEKIRLWLTELKPLQKVSLSLWKALRHWEKAAEKIGSRFHFGVSPYYLSLAQPEDPFCPIMAQLLPRLAELDDPDYTREDPLAEESYMPVPGLTHRYPDRVLWYISHNCALYCRFCMRRRKVAQPESAPRKKEREDALEYIGKHKEIKEVILSGGDPLSLSDSQLETILEALRSIKHIYSIRIHSRMPVVLPMRITVNLGQLLRRFYPITIVTHFNHAHEITSLAREAIRELRMNGVLVLNQAVLLKEINDTVAKQEALILNLLKAGVKPYYLHRLDPVWGTSHFRVPLKKGVEILQALRGLNPGIALPHYVIDLPGGGGKVTLEPQYLEKENLFSDSNGEKRYSYIFRNWAGKIFEVQE